MIFGWAKVGVSIGCLVLVAFGTWWATSTWYEKEIAEAEIEAMSQGRELERAEATKTIEVMNGQFIKLRENADRTLAERDDARRLVERLRKSGSSDLSGASSKTICALRKENARLRDLVERGIVLLQRGREGYRDAVTNNDALIEFLMSD